MNNFQDWKPVVFNERKTTQKITTEKKTNVKNLDNHDDEIKKQVTISLSNSKLIQQARLFKKLSQKDLANKINKDVRTIQRYESGIGVPELGVMLKIEKALGIKLNKKKNNKKLFTYKRYIVFIS